jgi:multiple sugar transport system permease protein
MSLTAWAGDFLGPLARKRLAPHLAATGLLLPGALLLLLLIAWPFGASVYLAMTDAHIRRPRDPTFIGLENFVYLLEDETFLRAVANTFIFTFFAVMLKIGLGLAMALLVFRLSDASRRWATSLLLFPWVAPIALTVIAWVWIFDSQFSPVNWLLLHMGLMSSPLVFLGEPTLAMVSVIIVNAWRGFPFFGLLILAGLVGIPRSLYEAAEVDGASGWRRFRYITLPMLRVVLLILVLYSMIFTFNEFAVIHVLTRGGPADATQVFSTLAFQRGILSGNIGEAAAITLFLLPIFLVVSIGMLRLSGREKQL